MYGRAEDVVGALVQAQGLRERLFLATKVWTAGRAAGERQMEASSPSCASTRSISCRSITSSTSRRTLRRCARGRRRGRVRYVGVTHYTATAHDAVARILDTHPVDFVQINYFAARSAKPERRVPCRCAHDKGVAVIANRPLAQGALLRRLAPPAVAGLGARTSTAPRGRAPPQVRDRASRGSRARDPGDVECRAPAGTTCARAKDACPTERMRASHRRWLRLARRDAAPHGDAMLRIADDLADYRGVARSLPLRGLQHFGHGPGAHATSNPPDVCGSVSSASSASSTAARGRPRRIADPVA
jgi:hypothetical protein